MNLLRIGNRVRTAIGAHPNIAATSLYGILKISAMIANDCNEYDWETILNVSAPLACGSYATYATNRTTKNHDKLNSTLLTLIGAGICWDFARSVGYSHSEIGWVDSLKNGMQHVTNVAEKLSNYRITPTPGEIGLTTGGLVAFVTNKLLR